MVDVGSIMSLGIRLLNERRKQEADRQALLVDLEKQDKMVAKYVGALSPVKEKASGKWILDSDAIDAAIPEDHPMKGFGPQLRRDFQKALADPRNRSRSAEQILGDLATQAYSGPGAGGRESKHLASLQYKYEADTSWFGGFDQEDQSIRKPLGYDQFRGMMEEKVRELVEADKFSVKGYLSHIGVAGAGGFVAGAALGALPFGPVGALPTGTVWGGAAAFAEGVMYPIRRLAMNIPGVRERIGRWQLAKAIDPDWVDRVGKPFLATAATDIYPLTVGEKLASRLLTIPTLALKKAIAIPTAKNVLGMSRAKEGLNQALVSKDTRDLILRTLSKDVIEGRKVGKGFEDMKEMVEILKGAIPVLGKRRYGGVADPRTYLFDYEVSALTTGMRGEAGVMLPGLGKTPTARSPIKWEPGIGMAEEAPIYHHFRHLDEVGLEEAFNHPGGPLAGAKAAANRQAKRELATGMVTTEETAKAITKIQGRSVVLMDKIKAGAVKDLNEELRKLDVAIVEGMASAPDEAVSKGIHQMGEVKKATAREYHKAVATARAKGLNTPGFAKETITATTTRTAAEDVVNEIPSGAQFSRIMDTAVLSADDAVNLGQDAAKVNTLLHHMQGGGQLQDTAVTEFRAMTQRLSATDPSRMAEGEFNRLRALNQELEQAVSSGTMTPRQAYSQFSLAWNRMSVTSSLEAMGERGISTAEKAMLPDAGRMPRIPGEPHPVARGAVDYVEPPPEPIKPAVSTEPLESKTTREVSPTGKRVYIRDVYTDTLRNMSNSELRREAIKYSALLRNPETSTAVERGNAFRVMQEIDRRVYVEAAEKAPSMGKVTYTVDTAAPSSQIIKDMESLSSEQAWLVVDDLEMRLHHKYLKHRPYGALEPGEAIETFAGYRTQEEIELLGSLLTKEEYAAREAALTAYDRALIREGKATPGDKVPHMRSLEHLEQVQARHQTSKGGHYAPDVGWRPPAEVEMTARLTAKRSLNLGEKKKLEVLRKKGAEIDEQLAASHMPVTLEDADKVLRSISGRLGRGELTAEEALTRTIWLDEAVIRSDIPPLEKEPWLHSLGPVLSHLRKMTALTAFFAMLGVGPQVFELFGGESPFMATAEAGMLTTGLKAVQRGVLTAEREVLLRRAMKSGLITELIEDPQKFVMLAAEFMRGLPDGKLGGPTTVLKALNRYAKRGVKPGLRHILMSPYQKFDEALEIGKYIMNNPAVFRASYQVAEYHNIRNINTVLTNIFREARMTENPTKIAQRFEHLVPYMEKQVSYEWHANRLNPNPKEWTREGQEYLYKELRNKKSSMTKANKELIDIDIANIEKEIAYSQGELKRLAGAVQEYHSEWAKTAADAAREFPSVRVYLSLWDGPDFKKAPFMRNIALSPDEQVLVGRLREQLLHYKFRMDERGVDTITGSYAPVLLHPNFGADKFTQITGHEKAAAYMKFYRRSPGSRPLFPSTETTMRRYVSDTERRIQNRDFWKSGWDAVDARTRDFPLLAQAFDNLREGVRPIEMTWGNKLANLYVQFEAYKRLWFNPSAGGKHLIKQTSNWATTGFGESFYAYPEAYKHVVKRSMDLTRTTRSAMSRGGVTARKDQDRVINSFLHSVIPARNARQRLLDMGINTSDVYFSAGKEIFHRSQNAGAIWINLAELFDRGVSAIAGINMAAKRGLTAEQAMYGVYDLILKNNFLSRELNPGWMRNPKIRAFLMFQGTPFKIAERRVVQAYRSGRAIKKGYKGLREASKTAEGRAKLVRDFKNLRMDMKTTEREFKSNLFVDALMSEVDFFGTPIVQQFAKDIAVIGAASYGGAYWGVNLMHHFFHVPFFSGMTHDPVVALSPGPMNAWRMWKLDETRSYSDQDWMFGKMMQKWLGPTWIAPDILWKAQRLSRNDIPDLYKGSQFQYLFAIPAKHK